MTLNNIDIVAWEHNVYKCDSCGVYWNVSFPIRGNQTIFNEEALYCRECRCLGRLIQSKQRPINVGKMK